MDDVHAWKCEDYIANHNETSAQQFQKRLVDNEIPISLQDIRSLDPGSVVCWVMLSCCMGLLGPWLLDLRKAFSAGLSVPDSKGATAIDLNWPSFVEGIDMSFKIFTIGHFVLFPMFCTIPSGESKIEWKKLPHHQKQRPTKGTKNYFSVAAIATWWHHRSLTCGDELSHIKVDTFPPYFIWNKIGNWKIEILVRCEYGWPKWRVDWIKVFGLFSFFDHRIISIQVGQLILWTQTSLTSHTSDRWLCLKHKFVCKLEAYHLQRNLHSLKPT